MTIVVVSLGVSTDVRGQSKSENAKSVRAWSLKSGPGAPTNILPVGDVSRTSENLFLRVSKVSADYRLGEGDRLDIEIVGGGPMNDSLKFLTISNSGDITVPYLGSVRAAGMSAAELEASISKLLDDKQLIKSPEVLVFVTDYRAKSVFIVGEVDNPGEYVMSQELTLMEGILMAGGIDPGADSFAYLHRRPTADGTKEQVSAALDEPQVAQPGGEVIQIDLRPLKKGAVPDPDLLLRKGDVLVIPKSKDMRFYVIGDVRSAGSQIIPPPPERPISVSQAIAQAGGPSRTAKMSDGVLVRYSEDGSREERKVDFMAVLQGRQPDFPVKANDIIFIPGSNVKTIGYGILGMVPATIEQSGR
jgi:polysaccharide export outer membrane protein